MKITSLAGRRFGRLIVTTKYASERMGNRRRIYWLCECECGSTAWVARDNLFGGTMSCGCLARELARKRMMTHGKSHPRSRLYESWVHMNSRCSNPDTWDFYNYGRRGIKVCSRWRSFENFAQDMGDPPPGKTLGRVDNNGNYEPSNCRWETRKEQRRNTSRTLRIKGVPFAQLCEEQSVPYKGIWQRMKRTGESFEEAVAWYKGPRIPKRGHP